MLTRLHIEQSRLLNWGDSIGLLEASLEVKSIDLGMNHNLINDVLFEIQAIFRSCINIQTRYDPLLDRNTTIPPQQIGQQRKSSRRNLLERVLAISNQPSRGATRLQWAMIKKDSFTKLVDDLIVLNDRMESFLDRNTLESMHTMQIQSNMMLLQVTDEVTQLRLLVEALKIARPPTYDHRSETSTADLALFKQEAALIEQHVSLYEPPRIDLQDMFFRAPETGNSRLTGQYRQNEVWLEWCEQVEDGQASKVQAIIAQRIKKLAALLGTKWKSPLFRAPFCIGYVHDDRDEVPRYALVYKIELSPPMKYLGPQTLRESLTKLRVPSLRKRFALASALAESLFYLHTVSWLHKGINSDSVIFLKQERLDTNDVPGDKINISSPVLSGFDYSRPDLISEQTVHNVTRIEHELYRHPDLLTLKSKRSQRYHDIYSLGIVLIEIAMWQPIEKIIGIELRRSRLLEVGIQLQRLSERGNSLYSKLTARAGDDYADVVTYCITAANNVGTVLEHEEIEPDIRAGILEAFFENVVRNLERLKV